MRSLALKSFIFVFCFFPDVRIKAESKLLMTEPGQCLNEMNVSCAITSLSQSPHKLVLAEESELHFAGETIFIRNSEDNIELVSGTIYIKSRSKVKVSTVYADVTVEDSEALVEVESKRVVVTSILGNNKVEPADKREVLNLPGGYKNYIGRMNQKAISEVGFPHAINYKSTIAEWARVFVGHPNVFKEKLTQVRPVWARAVENIAEIQPRLIERRIAEVKRQKERERLAKIKRQREAQKLRRLFYQKTFNP